VRSTISEQGCGEAHWPESAASQAQAAQYLKDSLKMSAKNIGGPNGKKPASAATNLIGTSIFLLSWGF